MKHKKWIAVSLGLALFTAGCATALGDIQLEGLESLTQQKDPAISAGVVQQLGPLQEIADEAEASAPFLDIVQISIDDENDLVVFAIFALPQSAEPAEGEATFQASVEAIWRAVVQRGIPVNNISVAFMRVLPVNTLDRGLAPGGWLIGGITVRIDAANEYISGKVDEETRAEFWGNGRVQAVTLDQPYVGTPNHPLRTLEA
ncbi:MAG: hypothetical protein ACE5M4_04870 [Anaerolineales bacterium]